MTRFRLEKQNDCWAIVNENRNFAAGTVKCVVQDYNGDEIGVVGSFDGAVAALACHLSENPSKWEQNGGGRYARLTHEHFDDLVVEHGHDGRWTAFRNGYPLGNKSGSKTFSTATEARHTADLHAHDGHRNASCAGDGLSWLVPADSADDSEEHCWIEYRLGETVADAVEAVSHARREHGSGVIQAETVRTIRAALRRLCAIREASRFGSYDVERRSCDPYFVIECQGAAPGRVFFEEAARHYGKIALRSRIGPDVSDKDLEEMLSYILARMPDANLIFPAV